MSNQELSGQRDLTISAWHRARLGPECSAFDLDLVGMCKRCAAHLYVIEATRAGNKGTTWTVQTARRLNVPGFLITYATTSAHTEGMSTQELVDNLDTFSAKQIHPDTRLIGGQIDFQNHIVLIRKAHDVTQHGGAR